MSGIVTGKVFDLDLPQNKLLVLLAYADAAKNNDGTGIRLSAPRVAWKTGYSERQARRIIDSLIADKILVIRDEKQGQTPIIDIDFAAASQKQKPSTKPLTSDVTPTPDIAMSETPDIAVSPHNVLTKDNVKDSAPPAAGESISSPAKTDAAKPLSDYQRFIGRLAEICKRDISMKSVKNVVIVNAAELWRAGYRMDALNTFERWWYNSHWKGKKGEKPSLPDVKNEIKAAVEQFSVSASDFHSIPQHMIIGSKRSSEGGAA